MKEKNVSYYGSLNREMVLTNTCKQTLFFLSLHRTSTIIRLLHNFSKEILKISNNSKEPIHANFSLKKQKINHDTVAVSIWQS